MVGAWGYVFEGRDGGRVVADFFVSRRFHGNLRGKSFSKEILMS